MIESRYAAEISEGEFININKESGCDKKDEDVPEEKLYNKGKKLYNKGTLKDSSQH